MTLKLFAVLTLVSSLGHAADTFEPLTKTERRLERLEAEVVRQGERIKELESDLNLRLEKLEDDKKLRDLQRLVK